MAARAGVAVNTRDKVVTPLWSANTLSASRSWVPDLQHLMLNDLTWSYIIIKLKYTINKMHENHPETIPRHLWKNCLLLPGQQRSPAAPEQEGLNSLMKTSVYRNIQITSSHSCTTNSTYLRKDSVFSSRTVLQHSVQCLPREAFSKQISTG